MFLYDEVMHGDEYRYQIDENNPATPELISEIKSRIRKMYNYIEERIRIEFAPNGGNENPEQTILNFMQFEKERVMKKTHCFNVEIQITRGSDETQKWNNRAQYRACVGRNELLRLSEDVCLRKKIPDFSEWEDLKETVRCDFSEAENRKQAEEIRSEYFQGELAGQNADFLHYEAEKFFERHNYGCEHPFLSDIFENYGQYDKIRRLYEAHPTNPWLQGSRGDIEYYGYLGPPDYKKAFGYYALAAKCGNLRAKFQLGQMYKYGLYVKQNFGKYEKITKEIFTAVKKLDESLLPVIHYVVSELSYIEQEKGNTEKSLEYALQAKRIITNIVSCEGVRLGATDVEIIKHLRSMTGIDGSDLDLLDLAVILQTPCTVRLTIRKREYFVKSFYEKNKLIVNFRGKYFNGVTDFTENAELYGKILTSYFNETDSVEVI